MSTNKTFLQQIDDLKKEVRQLDDDFDEDIVEPTAVR